MEDTSSDNWKVVQTKTFTKWVNSKLKKAEFPTIDNIFTDLSSGIVLVNLLQALGRQIPKYNENPRSRIQKMENLTIILDFIKEQNISLVNIGPEDIVDGNQKLILGLIWTLISKLYISDILTNEFFTMKEEILNWAQRVTAGYKNVKIDDLSTSWQNGLGFNAIIHKFRPNLVPDMFLLDPNNKVDNCDKAFKIAEDYLEIPRLFDPEDIIDVIRPDEKSVMTYLAQFYQKFLLEEKQINANDKIKKIIKAIDWSIEARNSYEKRSKAFIEESKEVKEKLSALSCILTTFCEEIHKIQLINTKLITESAELHLLLNDIQDVHRLMSLKEYNPPNEVSIDKIDISYFKVSDLFDFNKIKNELIEFENIEAQEVSKMKDISNEIYKIEDKKLQIAAVDSKKSCFSPVHLLSPSKQAAIDKLRQLFESKNEKLKKFVDLKNASEEMIEDAKKMFKIKDLKKNGLITVGDFKRILRALRFEPAMVDEATSSMEGFVSCEKMVDILDRLNFSKTGKTQVANLFKELGIEEKIDLDQLFSEPNFKGILNLCDENGELEVKKIIDLIIE